MKKFQTIDATTLRERLASEDRPVVDLGFTEVTDVEGGIEEWERAGYALQRSRAMATA